jgi:predicted GTPase
MATGAGVEAARAHGAAEMIDPRPYAQGGLADVYRAFPHLGPILPALGYYPEQLRDLEATIRAVPADVVLSATPSSLTDLIQVDKPIVQVSYEMVETGGSRLSDTLRGFLRAKGLSPGADGVSKAGAPG